MPAMLKPHEREDRAARLAPLFVWMEARGIFGSRVVRKAFERRGRAITPSHANQIKGGLAPAPEWLIEECCAVLCVPVSLIYPDSPSSAKGSAKGSAGSFGGSADRAGSQGSQTQALGVRSQGSHEWSVA